MKTRTGRTYDLAEQAAIITLWTATGNGERTARMLGIPSSSVYDMVNKFKAGKLPHQGEVAGLTGAVKTNLTQLIVEKVITCFGLVDPRRDLPFRDLVWGGAVMLDKALLLSGQATGRMEVKDLDPARTRERVTEIFRLIEQAHREPAAVPAGSDPGHAPGSSNGAGRKNGSHPNGAGTSQ